MMQECVSAGALTPRRSTGTAARSYCRDGYRASPPAALAGNDAEAVVFDLVQPLAAGRQLRGVDPSQGRSP